MELALERMTWPQVKAAVAHGMDTVIVPLGATEQHGPHLPLCADTTIISAIARRVAQMLGNALVAPAVPVGCSRHHLAFSGTLSLRPETLTEYLTDLCESLVTTGFHAVFLISGHGGNLPPLLEGLPKIQAKVPSLRVVAYTERARFMAIFHESASRQGVPTAVAGRHSGELETSMMLALEPHLVQMDEAEEGYMGDPMSAREILQREGMHRVSPNGVLGDPRHPDAGRGSVYMEDFARAMVDYFYSQLGGTS